MRCDVFPADRVFGDAFLVAAHQIENLEGSLVDFVPTITDDADHDFLPAIGAPRLRTAAGTQMGYIFNDAAKLYVSNGATVQGSSHLRVHGLDEKDLVLIVHCHDDEQFRFATIQVRPQSVLLSHEIVRVTGRGGVAHSGHLLALVATSDNVCRNGDIEHEVALLEFDLALGL
jgi:hypothetical protein